MSYSNRQMELQQSVILISHFDFDFLVISHFDFDFLAMISLFGLSFCYSFYGYLLAQNGVMFCLKKKKNYQATLISNTS